MTATNWLPAGPPGTTDDVVIVAGGAIVVLTNNVAVQSVVISNQTLRFNVWNNALIASNVNVQNGGVITHTANSDTATPWAENAGVFIECTNLTVAAGGAINGDALGYGGGPGNVSGYGPGLGVYSSGGICGGGGGYGASGGYGNANDAYGGGAYGSASNPTNAGSGGAGGDYSLGGAGGGFANIVVSELLTVNGTISMNGTNSTGGAGGGGSGGGIKIQCGNLIGNGIIRANGGNGGGSGGGGGGGRIAVTAGNTTNFSGHLSANCGSGYLTFPDNRRRSQMPGTVYLSDWAILPPMLTNGAAHFTAVGGMAAALTISNYTMLLAWGWDANRLRAGEVTVKNNGRMMQTWNTDTTDPWTPNGGIFIECTNLTVEAGGLINGDGFGYGGSSGGNGDGYGPGRGRNSNPGVGQTGGGGGYGGAGGRGQEAAAAGGSTYDTMVSPTNPGSGGAGGNWSCGGGGGGYVIIVASRTVTINGIISMNGTNGYPVGPGSGGGGGSGGGIYIHCRNLAGNGVLRANGGNCDAGSGGGGGGGRIALYVMSGPVYTYASSLLFSTPRPSGGTGWSNGTPGTIYTYFKPRGTMVSMW
jgi:hypothetical protein